MNIKFKFSLKIIISLLIVITASNPQISRGGEYSDFNPEVGSSCKTNFRLIKKNICDDSPVSYQDLLKNQGVCTEIKNTNPVKYCCKLGCIQGAEIVDNGQGSTKCQCNKNSNFVQKGNTCVCNENYYGTNSCTKCKESYPYSEIGTTNENRCYRSCVKSDIGGCNTIKSGGKKYKDNKDNTCECTQCNNNFYKKDNACEECPKKYPNSISDNNNSIDRCFITTTEGMYLSKDQENQSECVGNQDLTNNNKGNYCPSTTIYYNNIGGNQPCPDDYPKSKNGAREDKECYRGCNNTDIPNCLEFDTNNNKKYNKEGNSCKCSKCNEGYFLKENNTKCLKAVKCSAGTYLPANKDNIGDCKKCTDGKYCPGSDTFIPNHSDNQGIKDCPDDYPKSDIGNDTENNCYKLDNNGEYKGCSQEHIKVYKDNRHLVDDQKYYSEKCNNGCMLNKNICVPCSANHWCAGDDKGKQSKNKYTLDNIQQYCNNVFNNTTNKSTTETNVWVNDKGCKCPVGMSSKEQAKTITDCKYTKDTKFCFPTPVSGNDIKCFSIKELEDLNSENGKYNSSWKVIY